jgi:hypothetical protein
MKLQNTRADWNYCVEVAHYCLLKKVENGGAPKEGYSQFVSEQLAKFQQSRDWRRRHLQAVRAYRKRHPEEDLGFWDAAGCLLFDFIWLAFCEGNPEPYGSLDIHKHIEYHG